MCVHLSFAFSRLQDEPQGSDLKTELSTVNETVGADKPREPKATSKRLSLAVTGKEAGQNYSGVSDVTV